MTTFAFNGVQQKAKNTVIQDHVSKMEKALRLYDARMGYPFQVDYATGEAFTDMDYYTASPNMAGVCVGNWESMAPNHA